MKICGFEIPQQLEADLVAARTILEPNEIAALQAMLTGVDGPAPSMYGLDGIVRLTDFGSLRWFSSILGRLGHSTNRVISTREGL